MSEKINKTKLIETEQKEITLTRISNKLDNILDVIKNKMKETGIENFRNNTRK